MDSKKLNLYYEKNRKVENTGFINTNEEQNKIISYLNPETAYRSLIVSFKVGAGKTFAAVCLSHLYLKEGYKVLYLSNSITSITNFNNEYKNMCLMFQLNSYINKISSLTYAKMNNYKEKTKFGLVILDEAHNLRENGIRYKKIKNKIDEMDNVKLLIITATPMVDNIKELETIYNIAEDKILFSNKLISNIKVNYIGDKIGDTNLFLSEIKGIQLKEYLKINEDVLYTKSRIALISNNDTYNPNIPLEEQSSKIYKLLPTIKEGLTVIFCFYIKRGINFLSQVLKHEGYVEWNKNNNSNNCFAIIDGNKSQIEINEIMKEFNSMQNVNGSKIKILIGSSVLKESITIKNVKRLHILSPYWNFGEINQYIGRVIRMNSHMGTDIKEIDIYLHAAYYGNKEGIDLKIWKLANKKKNIIENKLRHEQFNNNLLIENEFSYPEPNNILIIKKDDWIWDLTNCFDTNKYKISWCNIYPEKVVAYDLKNKMKIFTVLPSFIKIFKPNQEGYTIWKSVIDNRYRITFIDSSSKKKSKRGLILNNMKQNYIDKISSELNCDNTIISIINKLKLQNRYIEKQIEIC